LADHRSGRPGLGRGPAQQRQDQRGRDQTFHVPSAPRGLVLAPSLIPCMQCQPCSMNRV
jgi:hypothetical protein